MGSTEGKGEDLTVERALDATGEETEEETAEEQNLWMLHQVFGVWLCRFSACSGIFFAFAIIVDRHWKSHDNC